MLSGLLYCTIIRFSAVKGLKLLPRASFPTFEPKRLLFVKSCHVITNIISLDVVYLHNILFLARLEMGDRAIQSSLCHLTLIVTTWCCSMLIVIETLRN